jgi:hypothetical protein
MSTIQVHAATIRQLNAVIDRLDTAKYTRGPDEANPREGAYWLATPTVGDKLFVCRIGSGLSSKYTGRANIRFRSLDNRRYQDVSIYIDDGDNKESILQKIKKESKYVSF